LPMRIAFVYDVIYPEVKGGVEKRVWELATRLAAKGHETHIYGMKYWDGADTVEREGVTIHGVCPAVTLYKPEGRRSIRQVLYYTLMLPVKLYRERFDIIDCQSSPYIPAYVCWLYGILKGVPVAITWHEVWAGYWREYLGAPGIFGSLLEKGCMRLTRHHIAVSESTKRKLAENGVGCEAVIPNGVDMGFIRIVKPSNTKSDIIFVGRLIKSKNVDVLIEAAGKLKASHPNVKVLVVGDGPERIALEEKARTLGLGENIQFTGFMETYGEVIALMKSSKVFALPSTREGFAIAAVEAAASGLPIVTVIHRDNAAADLVSDGVDGLNVRLDSRELADAFGRLLGDDDYRTRLGEAARKMAAGYDWDRSAEKLLSELHAVTRI